MTRAARAAALLARLGLGLGLLVAVLLATAAPAAAHADLLRSEPATGTTVDRAPATVRLFFTEPVDPVFTRITIRGANNQQWSPRTVTVDPGDSKALVVAMPALNSGAYAVAFSTTTTDGHTAGGDVLLGVGGGADLSALGPATPAHQSALLRRAAIAGRLVWYVGLCLAAGAVLWTGAAFGRLVVGWWILLGATFARVAILLTSLAAAAPGTGLATIVSRLRPTTTGRAWFVAIDVVLLAGLLVRRRARGPLVVAGAVLVVAEVATGHAALSPHPALSVLATSIHLGALAVWGSGLVVLAALARSRRDQVPAFLRRFSPVALGAVGALFATGALMAWIELGGVSALTRSDYGRTLLIKLGLIAVVLPLGLWHRFAARAIHRLSRTVGIELALVGAVVVAASVLASLAPGRTPTTRATLASSARPTTAAACRSAPIETASCWEQYFTHVVKAHDATTAINEIKVAARSDRLVKAECHQLTHTVGRETFKKLNSATSALRFATSLCNSGYQHGVIEEAISRLDNDQLRAQLPTFCTPGVSYRPYSFDHHNCTHGLGHGIATQKGEDVFAATPFCDVLKDSWEQQSCYGGVFMQKVIGDINRPIPDPHIDDPVWPCDVVPDGQKEACYLISTGRVLRLLDYDWPAAFKVCDNVEVAFRVTCYESMGRDISGYTILDPIKTRDLCLKAGALGPDPCIRGAVRNAVDEEHGSTHASALCAIVPPEFRDACRNDRDAALSLL